jgi:hypothetical protein|nr:hypothetical protein [uncultured Prevotella sp.]DAV55020.1 MAG TPA: hypothetical protein [Caudoviricetes sp.]
MDKQLLKQNYENACNAYLKAFCDKHDFYYEDAYWCGDDIGGIADCSTYTFDMATIRTDIDEDAPKEELLKYDEYCLNALEFKLPAPNFHAWIHGCPRTSDEWFKMMHNAKEDFENKIEEEKNKF